MTTATARPPRSNQVDTEFAYDLRAELQLLRTRFDALRFIRVSPDFVRCNGRAARGRRALPLLKKKTRSSFSYPSP